MSTYVPELTWKWNGGDDGKFGSLNRPTSGARYEKKLPVGKHPLQLYSLGTPNGVKVTIMLEELLALGCDQAEYDAHLINIMEGDQFSSGFVELNPNSKIPVLLDTEKNIRVFESGAILLYLAEKYQKFLPTDLKLKAETLNWLFWQVGAAPYLGGGFGHFYQYAPMKLEYPIDRFAMETKRQLSVLDQHLEKNKYMVGDEYTIADMAIWPWYGVLIKGKLYEAAQFLEVASYKHLIRWADLILAREPVKRGRLVNRAWGDEKQQILERHSKEDFKGIDLSF